MLLNDSKAMTVAPKPPVKEGAARGVTEQSGAQKQLTAWHFLWD